MLPRHLSTEAGAAARGRAFGHSHAEAVHRTIAAYERMFEDVHQLGPSDVRAIGRRAGDSLSETHPEVVEEIVAIADAAGAEAASVLALNARTEILAGVGPRECSAIGILPERSGAGTILAQNWDWHPDLAESRIVWTVVEPDGSWLTTLTEAGILAKVGVNSRGLGLCLNILGSSRDGGVDGVPVHVLCRLVLQRAGDLSQARATLAAAEATASSCFNVAGAGPDGTELASFELSPLGIGVVEPEQGILLHTNHFLAPLDAEDLYRRDWPDTLARLAELDRRVRNGPRRIDTEFVKAALRSHDAGAIAVCCHDAHNPRYADRQATLASVYVRLDDRKMEIAGGAPCQAPFRTVTRSTLALR